MGVHELRVLFEDLIIVKNDFWIVIKSSLPKLAYQIQDVQSSWMELHMIGYLDLHLHAR